MLKLILGRSGCGKTTTVLRRLCADADSGPQILLVPEQQSHEAERSLCRVGGNGVSLYAEVLSFTRLAHRIFLSAGGLGEEELDGGGRVLLMYQAVKAVSSQLTALGRVSCRPAFLESLIATVDELKSGCVRPEDLARAGEGLEGPEGDKLRDLALIQGTYDALTARTALDPRDRLTRAAEGLRRCGWARGKTFWLDGFTDFTPQQLALVGLLLEQGVGVTVTLTCDQLEEDEGGVGVFSPARRTGQRLLRLGKERATPCEVEHLISAAPARPPALEKVERELFAREGAPFLGDTDPVVRFSAQSPRSEVEWAAAQILDLVRDQGLRFRDIGVVARTFDGYGHLIASIFPRYGVPVFCSQMSDILEKPVLSLVTAALDTVSGGYQYEDVFRYLKTGLTDLGEEDRDLLENYVLRWDLRGARWTQQKAWSQHPRGYGASMEEGDAALLARLDGARRQVAAPLEGLRKNKDVTGRGQAMALYAFLEEIGLPQRLADRVEQLRVRGEHALAEEYRQLWEILCGGLEQCAQLLGETPIEREEFTALFKLVLSQYDVGTIPVSLDRVTAGETKRQTGHRVKALFLLGAEDGALPLVTADTGLLSDDDRSLLASYGLEVGQTGEERLLREMTTIYQICALPTQRLYVTWPRRGTGGEEKRPSFLVERLRALLPGATEVREGVQTGAFRLCAPLPALEQAGRDPRVRQVLAQLPECQPAIQRLERARRWERGSLSRQAVDRLYGRRVPLSASRMDKYKSCHFSYFMRYGLKAQPRKRAGFDAPEYGTFVHYVLERVLGDPAWRDRAPAPEGETSLTQEQRDLLRRLTDGAVEEYVQRELGGLEHQTDRFRYLFRRLLRSVHSVVDNAAQELCASQFQPISFELGFAREGALPPVELTVDDVTVSISGFVDRVDGWVHDGRLYLRVVDYKTGRKSFDLTEIWNGLGLQMLLYLFTLQERGETVYGLPVEGAGVLYLPARDAIIRGSRAMSDDLWRREVDKQLRRSGIILDDPAVVDAMETAVGGDYRFLPLKVTKTGQISGDALVTAQRLGKLQAHIQTVLEEICREIAAGNIAADPFWRGPEKNACRWCDFADACQFEEGRGGDCRRWLPTVKGAEFWQRLEGGQTGDAPPKEGEDRPWT